jgi:aspartate aminotransferase
MQLLSHEIESYLERSSWIRRMFETGIELKKEYGAENVFDFSLGNPDVPPPAAVAEAMIELAGKLEQPLVLGYMPNAGYPEARTRLAAVLSREQETTLTADHLVLTCGAAGGINAFFRAVLEPGDEIVCPAPYFVEYGFYAANAGGTLKPAPSKPLTFKLDLAALEAAITPKTRALIINSPNNPTGVVYSREELAELAGILAAHSRRNGRPIFLVADEPYRFLTYDGIAVPPILPLYTHAVVIGSFSKNLALAGERVGYIAVNPAIEGLETLLAGITLTNRILGFVNAPAIGQRLMMAALDSSVDIRIYRERRDAMARVLQEAGIEFSLPQGAFYFFPKAPDGLDDKVFVDRLMKEQILAVPGSGFGYPGYFRLTFCIDKTFIENAAAGFKRAVGH